MNRTPSISARKGSSRPPESRRASKFIPNLTQLKEATQELPDPELWPEETCVCPVMVNEKQKLLEFTRKRISRGNTRPYRWIYEGKILIRNRDI